MTSKIQNYRISLTSIELSTLAAHLSAIKSAASLSRELNNVLVKCNVAIAKIAGEALVPAFTSTGAGGSTVKQLSSGDDEMYLLEHGTEEQKAAINAAIEHAINTGESIDWREFLVTIPAQFSEVEAEIAVVTAAESWKEAQ